MVLELVVTLRPLTDDITDLEVCLHVRMTAASPHSPTLIEVK
jgi:hypothetical protein